MYPLVAELQYLLTEDEWLSWEMQSVELGMDLPGTEFGVDVLVHSKAEKRFIGFGLSFGI